ncbi:isochorismate synthase [Natronolimnobius sp. AArcel1]|uniref:isochorismate synthase n=1 Tax=Natronolimnobius sp. AArcel1 TaxID=1679093 RepID=UPI0013EC4C4A|nr:isochorismate synthase [Natronolimnobius sp. AArcel1]NGM70894.1 isochorismate synthase [Natronolimnobius sp. AArcel1]
MDGTSEGRLAGTPHEPASETLEEPLVSASRELADVSFGAITDAEFTDDEASQLRLQWATPDGLEIVGRGVAARLTATGPDRFAAIRQQASDLFVDLEHNGPAIARPRAFGGVAFHDSHDTTTAGSTTVAGDSHWEGFDAASFVVPRVFVTRSDTDDVTGNAKIWLTAVGTDASATNERLERWDDRLADLPAMQPSGTSPGVAKTERTTTREQWASQVDDALERIATDRLRKVVLAQALSVDLEDEIDVASTLERLRRRYPNCYRFLISGHDGSTFFGAPPERLVSKRGDHVETEALAGSAPRGEAPEEDEAFADEMLSSDKLDREHDLVVEAIRDQLEGLASELHIGDRGIRKLATIQHLQTPIEATLAADRHVLELVEGLHPTPAVGGMPPDAAWETIRDTEPFDRGWYASPIGWFDANGDGEFAVGLRSGVATADRVTLFAGNGIVADSDPDEEWEEVQLKFRPILDELR